MAKLDPTPYPMPSLSDFKAQIAEIERLTAASNALDESEYEGALIKFQVADGYAYYLVTSMAGSATVQFVPFGDEYTVHDATIRGLRKQDIKDLVDADRHLAQIFGKGRL